MEKIELLFRIGYTLIRKRKILTRKREIFDQGMKNNGVQDNE